MRVGLLMGVLALATIPLAGQGKAQGAATSPPGSPVLVFETEKGTFEIETFPQHAPKTVAHIVALVQRRFYTGLRVHRVEPNFVVQLGDPLTRDMRQQAAWGTGNSGKPIGVVEFGKGLKHAVGLVSMAHDGRDAARTSDSQFFIVIGPASHLDGLHQIWGRVSTGMPVVMKLAVPDRIIRATVKGAK
jgi:peptidyl-prolyl cis-trans isomerase B (cyclophilin B)